MNRKKLPIGVQSFETMIEKNHVYIDKTAYVYKLVDEGMFYFLARPRRFGKSLLISTLKALFEGRKELFKGLWIENSDWQWQPHPVVEIDFSEVDLTDVETFQESLSVTLDRIADLHGVRLKNNLLADRFVELILAINKKCQEKVVVLVDEYDKPIITHLGKGEAAMQRAGENRDLLKNFFGILKGARVAAALRFVFITGISKFSKVSIFSELNNLQDLTMHAAYSGMLGYTQDELEHAFSDWIADFAQKQNTGTGDILSETPRMPILSKIPESDSYANKYKHIYSIFLSLVCSLENQKELFNQLVNQVNLLINRDNKNNAFCEAFEFFRYIVKPRQILP